MTNRTEINKHQIADGGDIYWYCISEPGMSLSGAWTEWKPDWPPTQITEERALELIEESTDHIATLAGAKRRLDEDGCAMLGRRQGDIRDYRHLYLWNNRGKLDEERQRIANDNMTDDEKRAKWKAEEEEKYKADLAIWTEWHMKVRGTEPKLRPDNKHFVVKD